MSTLRQARGAAARAAGRRGEVLAALMLMAKGYRILGFRLRAPQAEIDLLAKRGGRAGGGRGQAESRYRNGAGSRERRSA